MTTCFERFTQPVERPIATKVIRSILNAGYEIQVHDGEEFNSEPTVVEEHVKANLASTGDDRLYFRKPGDESFAGWVWLIWGNGEDLISDYTANDATEVLIAPIIAEIDA
jgi:hypothetical protein